ncbi:MAG TPA: fused MFS/spermidine synthase [Chloroflexota bacterium]|nr:fused MFS/spermidine synthase [Chloroflexota bacterium]
MAAPSRALPRAQVATATSGAWLLRLLLVLFFCSGISGLIYQVLWLRVLSLVFGVTIFAVSTVLASFMAGLAVGSFGAGKLADRLRNPLAAYGIAETLIGLTALVTPELILGLQGVYHALYEALGGAPLLVGGVRIVLAFLILLVPTSLMGATLPIVIKSSLMRSEGLSQNVSLLYAVNTFGAIVGAGTAGFFLVGSLGIRSTTNVAAAINLLVGVAALLAAWRLAGDRGWGIGDRGQGPASSDEPLHAVAPVTVHGTNGRVLEGGLASGQLVTSASPSLSPGLRLVFWAFGISGCLSLAYEVVWSRVLSMFFNSSVYAFTVMLCTVLFGIALGSYAINPFMRRRWNWVLVFAILELAVALTAVLSILTLSEMYTLTAALQDTPGIRRVLSTPIRFMAFVSFVAIFPPMFLLGMTFPVAARIYAANAADAGRRIGAIYSANVFGAIFGSVIAGFLLIPHLGSQNSLAVLAAGNLLVGLALLAVAHGVRPRARALVALVPLVLLGAVVVRAPNMYATIFEGREQFLRTRPFVAEDSFCAGPTVWYEESLENTVSVVQTPSDIYCLFTNSRGQTNTDPGLVRYHRLIGHFGMLLHPHPRDVLVVGLGGGATPGAASQWEDARVDVVELSDGVVHAAPWFDDASYDVVNQPNVHLRVDDGRNYLLLTDKRYDVVTADIIRPNDAGAANLYSADYYRLVRNVLKDDGLMVQWLAPFSDYQYKLLMRTFLDVFPYVTLWSGGDLLVGSKSPITVDPAMLATKFEPSQHANALADIGLTDAQQVLDMYNASKPELLDVAGPGPIITDNFPYVEYFRSLPKDGYPDLSVYSHNVDEILK